MTSETTAADPTPAERGKAGSDDSGVENTGSDNTGSDNAGSNNTGHGSGQAAAEGSSAAGSSRVARLEREGDIAADYLEGLLDIADLDGDIDLDVEGDRASVAIVGSELDELVGPNGRVLEALQELTRLAVQAKTGERSRLMLDVSGYRAGRRTELLHVGKEAARRAKESGERIVLPPMSAFERKVVHDAVAAEGLRSESEGVEPARKVVVLP